MNPLPDGTSIYNESGTRKKTHFMCLFFLTGLRPLSIYLYINNVIETVKKIQPLAFILWKKRPLLQQSVQLKHNIKKAFYGDLDTSNDWSVFFRLPELKAFSIKHFPQDNFQTTKQVDAFVISRSRKICFVGPELTVPIKERIAFWNKILENDSRSWFA